MPCKRGYRAQIDASKERREQERIYERSGERRYWRSLVTRVHSSPDGFERLAMPEKTYFAVSCLIGEVYNGGFGQFFSNSSGDLYAYALDGLLEMEAEDTAALLGKAKQIVFGDAPIPIERGARNIAMKRSALDALLDELDKAFWADRDDLGDRCKRYACTHELFEDA